MARRDRSRRSDKRSRSSRSAPSRKDRDLAELEAERAARRGAEPDIEEDEYDEPRSGRRGKRGKGKKKGKKRIDVMPIVMVLLLVAAGGAALLYFPMQKKTLMAAVRGGDRMGFDAAIVVSRSPSAIPELCSIVEKNATGRMAAAAALALIARRGSADAVVTAIEARLQGALPAEAKAAYAAALAQSRADAGEQAAAALAKDPNAPVREKAIRGLAVGRSAAGPAAVGAALGDADDGVRDAAKGVVLDWTVVAPEKAVQAAMTGLELEQDFAQAAAAEVLVEAADKLAPEQALALLSNPSARVRELGLRAVVRNPSLLTGGEGPVAEAVVKLLDPRGQPVNVKSAALEVVMAGSLQQAAPGAMELLKRDPDPGVRAKAALAVATTLPPGAWEALSAPLVKEGEPRQLQIACLEAIERMRQAPPEKFPDVARVLLKVAGGEDTTLAGLALNTLRAASGKSDVKYGAEQWKKYVARRAFEAAAMARARELFAKMKKEYDADPDDWERIKNTIQEAGLYLQEKVIENADDDDKQPMKDLVTEMVTFNKKIRKPINR